MLPEAFNSFRMRQRFVVRRVSAQLRDLSEHPEAVGHQPEENHGVKNQEGGSSFPKQRQRNRRQADGHPHTNMNEVPAA